MPSEFSKCYSLSVNTVVLSFGMDDPLFLFFVHLLGSEEIVHDMSLQIKKKTIAMILFLVKHIFPLLQTAP